MVDMGMSRRRFTEWEVIATLIGQGVTILCFRCKLKLPLPTRKNMVQREHIHEVGFDGPDIPANCRYSHYDCHSVVTNGTKATTAGSSKHRLAKADRLKDAREALTTSLAGGGNTAARGRAADARTAVTPSAWNSRCRRCGDDFEDGICPNCGPPIQRPFQKRQAVRG